MKKLIFAAALAVSITISAFSQSSMAENQVAERNFETVYSEAWNVGWVSNDNFTKAVFSQDGRNFEAYYTTDGDWFATTTYLDMKEAPNWVKNTLAKKYSDYTINAILEVTADLETAYFISAEDDDQSVILKVASGSISMVKKADKAKM